jgi:hypothetical protein
MRKILVIVLLATFAPKIKAQQHLGIAFDNLLLRRLTATLWLCNA